MNDGNFLWQSSIRSYLEKKRFRPQTKATRELFLLQLKLGTSGMVSEHRNFYNTLSDHSFRKSPTIWPNNKKQLVKWPYSSSSPMMTFILYQKALWILANEIGLAVTFRIHRTQWINIWTNRFPPFFFSTKPKWHPPRKTLSVIVWTYKQNDRKQWSRQTVFPIHCDGSQPKCCTERSSVGNNGHKADTKNTHIHVACLCDWYLCNVPRVALISLPWPNRAARNRLARQYVDIQLTNAASIHVVPKLETLTRLRGNLRTLQPRLRTLTYDGSLNEKIMTCGYELIDIYIEGGGFTTHALPHYFAVAMEKSKKGVFHLLIESLFLRITAKNGWYNVVTTTTLNTSMLLFTKRWRQDSRKFPHSIQKAKFLVANAKLWISSLTNKIDHQPPQIEQYQGD